MKQSVKSHLANFIYRIYGQDIEKIPYIFLWFVITHGGGGWAGVSVFMTIRHHHYRKKLRKFFRWFWILVSLTIVVSLFLPSFNTSKNDFISGVSQNFFADLLFVLIAASFVIPFLQNKGHEYQLRVESKGNVFADNTISVYIENTGKKTFLSKEVKIRFYLPFGFDTSSIVYSPSDCQIKEDQVFEPESTVIDWVNNQPMFTEDPIKVFEIINPTVEELYYKIYTTHGNFPTIENASQDLLGRGFSGIVGKISFEEELL